VKNKVSLGFFPTPLHKLQNISALFKHYDLYIKRDDQTGLASGGNKTRKLEYLIADAITKKCKIVITMGAQQSNHCRQTAAACAILGLECHLVFRGLRPSDLTGNLLLCQLMGANLHFAGEQNIEETANLLAQQLSTRQKKTYVIPIGGSNVVGMQGYMDAVEELCLQQTALGVQFDYIFFASCSAGTQAGIVAGKHQFALNARLMPVSIQKSEADALPLAQKALDLCLQHNQLHSRTHSFSQEDVAVVDGYDEAGYGILTPHEKETIITLATTEGILLDPVYTARAFFAMMDFLKNKQLAPNSKVLFWHTGGLPAIFHYANGLV